MENMLVAGVTCYMALGAFSAVLCGPHLKIKVILVDDLGFIAAKAMIEPEVFIAQAIDIIGDEVSVAGMQKEFESVAGYRVTRAPVPWWFMVMMVPYA